MNTIETAAPAVSSVLSAAELEAIKGRQRATWASGDYSIIGTTLQIVGESLCGAVDLRAGSKVLDVAAGNGNCSLAAARRSAEAKMAPDFHPWRRNVEFLACTETPIRPLLDDLDFVEDKSRWGYRFRFGVFKIDEHDIAVIRSAMTG